MSYWRKNFPGICLSLGGGILFVSLSVALWAHRSALDMWVGLFASILMFVVGIRVWLGSHKDDHREELGRGSTIS